MSLIFLHGFMGDKSDWQELSTFLTQRYACIALDFLEHVHAPDYIEILHREMEHIPRAALVGYSLGGRIALQLAEKYPACFSHVILLSAHPGILQEEERKARLAQDLAWVDKLQNQNIASFMADWYNQPLFNSLHKKPELLRQIMQKRTAQDPKKMADVLRLLSVAKQKPIVTFHPKTLFLHGEEDAKYEKLYASLPGSVTVRKVEGSGHVIHLENPQRCAELILKWMEENP